MKIGIIGYGKMGKAIEKIAIDRGHSISFKTNDFNLNLIKDVDVTIEFSTPESAFTNIKNCLDSRVPRPFKIYILICYMEKIISEII